MTFHSLSSSEWAKAVGVGLATAVLLSAVMVPAMMMGISPMPKPLGLAFAQTLLGEVSLPVGLLFHVAYVTIWSVIFVVLFRDNLSFRNALALGLALWAVVLVVFFPIVGWGFVGLSEGPMLIIGSLVPHVLFAVFLWAGYRLAFRRDAAAGEHAHRPDRLHKSAGTAQRLYRQRGASSSALSKGYSPTHQDREASPVQSSGD